MKQTQQGFTLIELLISVAIVGILAKIAYPSYQENIKQSKRKEAQAALVSFANAMEMWKLQHNNSYLGAGPAGADTGAPTIFPTQSPVSGGTATYNLTIDAATAQTYTLKATPVSGYTDATCGWLSITSSGVKSSQTTSSVCW